MKNESSEPTRLEQRGAAEWYVELDAAEASDPPREAAFQAWLDSSSTHDAAYQRCEAVVALARRALEEDEVRRLLEEDDARRWLRAVIRVLVDAYRRPALAWSIAAFSALFAVVLVLARPMPAPGSGAEGNAPGAYVAASDNASFATEAEHVAAGSGEPGFSQGLEPGPSLDDLLATRFLPSGGLAEAPSPRFDDLAEPKPSPFIDPSNRSASAHPVDALAATSVASFVDLPPAEPVVIAPADLIVDARSLAVLPFRAVPDESSAAGAGEAAELAAQLYGAVLGQLAAAPGVYLADPSVAAIYGPSGLEATEVATHLGVRGVIEGELTLEAGQVRMRLRMADAAREGRSFEGTLVRPLDELASVPTDIVASIARTLAAEPRMAVAK